MRSSCLVVRCQQERGVGGKPHACAHVHAHMRMHVCANGGFEKLIYSSRCCKNRDDYEGAHQEILSTLYEHSAASIWPAVCRHLVVSQSGSRVVRKGFGETPPCGQNKRRGTRWKRIRVGGKLAEHLQIPTTECLPQCLGQRWRVGEWRNLVL